MSGHVFVIHGDVLKIDADVLLIPCDRTGQVLQHWQPYGPAPDRNRLIDDLQDARVSSAHVVNGQPLRYVDTGSTPTRAEAEWLRSGVVTGLHAAAADALARPTRHGRLRPLIATPLFGVGAGGFDTIRGHALRAQLAAGRETVSNHDVDVVIVCFDRSDFAALQRQRAAEEFEVPDILRQPAADLAAAVSAERLVLFLGAGVSTAAGLDTFATFVARLENRAGLEEPEGSSLPERVEAIETVKSPEWINNEVRQLVDIDRYSLTHGLLASLRVREAITTNFDRLYELSCGRPFADAPLEVLPWHRGDERRPWLLKAHGDPWHAGRLVLTKPSFDAFEADRATTAGVVRSMFALSREVLFIGYSLEDANIEKLVDEAHTTLTEFGAKHTRLGTIVDLRSTAIDAGSNPVRLGVSPRDGAAIAEGAAQLQIFLDYMLWMATRDESSWLLDERYAALHETDDERDAADRLRAQAIPSSGTWPVVDRDLQSFGRKPSRSDHP